MAREMNVVPYDAGWPALYEREKNALMGILGELVLDIQHFGSTSIDGMAAKPTIDVMVVVGAIAPVDVYGEAMAASGYIARGEQGIHGRRYFVRLKEDGENHAAHVHIYEKGNPHIADELLFRDFLRADREAFAEYENVKRVASEKHRHSPGEYQDAKAGFVKGIMEKAKQRFDPM